MPPKHFVIGRWWMLTFIAVVIGLPPTTVKACDDAAPPTNSLQPTAHELPPTLTALRVQILAPSRRSPACTPRPDDPWLAPDKGQHVVFSGLLTLSTQYVLVQKADWSSGDALPVSAATSATVGLGKEVYDASRLGGRASGKDLVANAVGIGLAVGIIAL